MKQLRQHVPKCGQCIYYDTQTYAAVGEAVCYKKRIDMPEFLQGKKVAVKVKEKDNACAWYSETIKGTA